MKFLSIGTFCTYLIEEKSEKLLRWQRKQNNWCWGICSKTVTTFSCTYVGANCMINTHLTFPCFLSIFSVLKSNDFLLTDGKL